MAGDAPAVHHPDSIRTGNACAAVQMLHDELAQHVKVAVTQPQASAIKVRTLLIATSMSIVILPTHTANKLSLATPAQLTAAAASAAQTTAV